MWVRATLAHGGPSGAQAGCSGLSRTDPSSLTWVPAVHRRGAAVCPARIRARMDPGRFVKGYNGKIFENAVRRLKPVAKLGPRAEINIFELKFSHSDVAPPNAATKRHPFDNFTAKWS